MLAENKFLTLTFIFMLLSSLLVLTVKPANSQSTFKPSVPEFSVKLIDNSYDEPPAYTTDPYTGETKMVYAGGHVDNRTIVVTIKNQPFIPYTNANGHEIELYYIIQAKGYYSEDWSGDFISPSEGEYTIHGRAANKYNDGSKIDYRVQTVVGYWHGSRDPAFIYGINRPGYDYRFEEIVSSDHSDIQTITIHDMPSQLSPSQTATRPQNPTAIPDNNQVQQPASGNNQTQLPSFLFYPFFWVGVGVLFVGFVVTLVILFIRRALKHPLQ